MKTKITKEQDIEVSLLYLKGFTSQQIADRFKCYKQSILNSLKRTKTERRKNWKRASGEKSSNWKGGTRKIKGYIHFLDPSHHLARPSDGYVPLHRFIVEKKIGRLLKDGEVVNHLDGDILNNLESNLEVFVNNGEHIKSHVKEFRRNEEGQFIKLN